MENKIENKIENIEIMRRIALFFLRIFLYNKEQTGQKGKHR